MTAIAASPRIVVIGCGHVGLVMAAGLTELGHDVIGIDIDDDLVQRLRRGETHIHEPGLPELVAKGIRDADLVEFDTLETVRPDELTPDWYERKMRENLKALAEKMK